MKLDIMMKELVDTKPCSKCDDGMMNLPLQAMKTTSLNDAKRKNNIRLLVIDTCQKLMNHLLGNL
jgi:hypothetical protein